MLYKVLYNLTKLHFLLQLFLKSGINNYINNDSHLYSVD